MPRVSRHRAKLHTAAASLPKRSFAVPDAQVDEVVLPGSAPSATLDGLPPIVFPEASSSKRKLPFVVPDQTLPLHPYSRSHRKRENKKARQMLAGGSLDPLAAALDEVSGHKSTVGDNSKRKAGKGGSEMAKKAPGAKDTSDKATEGRSRTLSEKARRKQIEREGLRARMVAKLPAFKQSPWAAIREHASNTLVQKEKEQ